MIQTIPEWFRNEPVFANVAEGIHSGGITRQLENAVTARYLLAKDGTAEGEVDVCGASDAPAGVMTDTGSAGDLINLSLIGNTATTVLMVASAPITAGADVYTAAGGKVQTQPASVGTYYCVGRALTAAAADGNLLEVEPVTPRKTVLIGAFTGVASADIAALGTALANGPDRLVVLPA